MRREGGPQNFTQRGPTGEGGHSNGAISWGQKGEGGGDKTQAGGENNNVWAEKYGGRHKEEEEPARQKGEGAQKGEEENHTGGRV